MNNKLSHFAIYTENITRAKKFYKEVFGWNFAKEGSGEFAQITLGNPKESQIIGALQSRKYAPIKEKVIGMECTINVDDIDHTIQKVTENGGRILLPKTPIPFKGYMTKFIDSEGNLVCAIQLKIENQHEKHMMKKE